MLNNTMWQTGTVYQVSTDTSSDIHRYLQRLGLVHGSCFTLLHLPAFGAPAVIRLGHRRLALSRLWLSQLPIDHRGISQV